MVVDPQRDVHEYLADAAEHGLRIERVIESHVHADFLSGHLELAETTGATVSFGSRAEVEFDIERALFRSTRDVLLALPDETRVFPAHGAGSACGKNLSTDTSNHRRAAGEQLRAGADE